MNDKEAQLEIDLKAIEQNKVDAYNRCYGQCPKYKNHFDLKSFSVGVLAGIALLVLTFEITGIIK